MKKLMFIGSILLSMSAFSQTNTFPASGNVGIGTLSPVGKLDINGAGAQLRLSGGTVAGGLFTSSTDVMYLADWQTGSKGLMVNMTSGNVGLGTPSPGYRLDVLGATSDWKARFRGADGYILMGPANADWAHIYTDRPAFMFNTSIYSMGPFSSYMNNLSLQTTGVDRLTILGSNGNVGIGTSSPAANLQIGNSTMNSLVNLGGYAHLGSLKSSGDFFAGYNVYAQYTATDDNKIKVLNSNPYGFSAMQMSIYGDIIFYNKIGAVTANDQVNISANTTMKILGNGNVGIGTTNPGSYKLAVEGKIGAREVTVTNAAPWPDYVFNDDYKLRPLTEVQQFIKENHHLPEVPSAKEVEANGQNLGAMNAVLLKKIEELTLYLLQQQKQIDAQQKEIDALKKH